MNDRPFQLHDDRRGRCIVLGQRLAQVEVSTHARSVVATLYRRRFEGYVLHIVSTGGRRTGRSSSRVIEYPDASSLVKAQETSLIVHRLLKHADDPSLAEELC